MAGYEKVRFVGYAVPTTPADIVPVGDPNGRGAVAGTYRAAADLADDIAVRAHALKAAVDAARETLAGAEPGVLNVFVAPEFYWHGPMGPYVHAPDEPDPADLILAELERLFPAEEYPDFLLVLGTAISARIADLDAVLSSASCTVRNDVVRSLGEAWRTADGPLAQVVLDTLVNFIKNCHSYPQVQVRNRSFVLGPGAFDGVTGPLGARAVTTEKYFDSNEDLLLWDVTGRPVITEQMAAYPILDTSGGDLKTTPRDPYSLFRIGGGPGGEALTVGVEICLDHADRRLRKGVDRSPWPSRGDGLDLHLIPSCGMQLHPPAVAARSGGWAFNCDGQYALGDDGGVPCVHADYRDPAWPGYGAHTQLARIETGPRGADQRGTGSHDARFAPAPDVDVTVIEMTAIARFDECFAGGPGAVHIYGRDRPLPR
ncbi:hypothetical protein [Gordonia sp. FQ]|uniref:hypothetical protein n=1 Tax=Gordonia sp. FQ TaxID=3446634 RepID=UPI003F847293